MNPAIHSAMHAKLPALAALLLLGLPVVAVTGCGDDAQQVTQQRGMPNKGGAAAGGAAAAPSTRRSGANGQGEPTGEVPVERPDRPRATLTREDFSGRARDPFHNYLAAESIETPVNIEVVRKQRAVKLAEYTFEELRLIAIVNAGRSVPPTALFLASDNKSKSVKQGEYFSSAEVLLASVNRDYIEIEIIDPELTPGWNMERGERKVIYLKDR